MASDASCCAPLFCVYVNRRHKIGDEERKNQKQQQNNEWMKYSIYVFVYISTKYVTSIDQMLPHFAIK